MRKNANIKKNLRKNVQCDTKNISIKSNRKNNKNMKNSRKRN